MVNLKLVKSNGNEQRVDPALKPFLEELTLLTKKWRIGIAGDPVLFCLEDEDIIKYFADDDSNLLY